MSAAIWCSPLAEPARPGTATLRPLFIATLILGSFLLFLIQPLFARLVLPVESATAQEHRLTLTLGRIVEAGLLALHIEGPDKKQVLDRVLAGEALPIRAAIEASPRPVEIFWAE